MLRVGGRAQAALVEEGEVRATAGFSEIAGAAVGDQGEAAVLQGPAGLFKVQADVVATRGVAPLAGVLIEAERPGVVVGDAAARGVEEGEVRAARGAAAVAGPAEQLVDAGVVGGAAVAVEITAAELGASGGAAGLTGPVEELVGMFRVGRHSPPLDVEDAELKAPRGPLGRAGLLMEREGAGQLHRLFEGLRPSPHGERDLLPGTLAEEQAFEGARAVHGRAVEGQEPVARTQPGAGGGTFLVKVLQDRSGFAAIRVSQAGAQGHRTRRTDLFRAAERQQQPKTEMGTHACSFTPACSLQGLEGVSKVMRLPACVSSIESWQCGSSLRLSR